MPKPIEAFTRGLPSGPIIPEALRRRGFLPDHDPATHFPAGSELAWLDELGRDLPSLLHDPGFRDSARSLRIPHWPREWSPGQHLDLLRLYYLRLGFLASAYVNQVGEESARKLPANIALPFCQACALLGRPPILSYDGYALYNWKRFRPDGPIALGNLDTLQNFVHLYDEHWFILVHVEIEALAAEILAAIGVLADELPELRPESVNATLVRIEATVSCQAKVLQRIPEKMDPKLYYRTFRPYIRFFENVVYEGVERAPMEFRGETGAQSSIMPTLVAFMKIPHRPSALTNHLADMRRYMPRQHRELIEAVEMMPSIRAVADAEAYNSVLEAIARFREIHLGWAEDYINRWSSDPRGTGGTPYMQWLRQLISETRAHQIA